jgi:hypothetical protein
MYSISVLNAYLCLPDDRNKPLKYDGIEDFGCLNVTENDQLISSGSVTDNDFLTDFYNPTLHPLSPSYTTVSVKKEGDDRGFSFF